MYYKILDYLQDIENEMESLELVESPLPKMVNTFHRRLRYNIGEIRKICKEKEKEINDMMINMEKEETKLKLQNDR